MSGIGDRLQEARINKGLSQIQVREITGINNKTLSGYEKGRNEPDIETIKILAGLYDVSPAWIIGDDIASRRISKLDDLKDAFIEFESYYERYGEIDTKLMNRVYMLATATYIHVDLEKYIQNPFLVKQHLFEQIESQIRTEEYLIKPIKTNVRSKGTFFASDNNSTYYESHKDHQLILSPNINNPHYTKINTLLNELNELTESDLDEVTDFIKWKKSKRNLNKDKNND